MTRAIKKKFKLSFAMTFSVLGVIACAFTIVDGSWVTFAWFSAQRTVSIDYASMIVASRDTVASVAVYPYHVLGSGEPASEDGVYTFEKTPTTTQNMGKYSLLRPTDNALLMEITLTSFASSADTVSVTAHTNASFFLGELDESNQLKQPLALTGNSLSSIVCFYAFAQSDVVDAGNYYSIALSSTKDVTGTKANFVSGYHLQTNVSLCSFSGPLTKFYLILDYDISLIEYVYSANIGNDTINDVTNIDEDGQSYLSFDQDFFFNVDAYFPDASTSSGVSS
jgi:hypothetical protein